MCQVCTKVRDCCKVIHYEKCNAAAIICAFCLNNHPTCWYKYKYDERKKILATPLIENKLFISIYDHYDEAYHSLKHMLFKERVARRKET